ncbi:hypothetical protein RHSIM_Rhsim08G0005800 [Rhododendron simsii]|uniref:DOG1 domain-containing protein n=1 Tax=Rhododendron simsii TaxID=118357 RepID=A0A834LEQ8_RHOSS|nr:hypothetical protein RHSIM_Rhsim08G0005800 [Rhododendron simsii]
MALQRLRRPASLLLPSPPRRRLCLPDLTIQSHGKLGLESTLRGFVVASGFYIGVNVLRKKKRKERAAQSKLRRSRGALAFDIDYACWLDEHQRLINDLRSAVNSHIGDNDLCVLVDGVMFRYDEIFSLKAAGAKSNVFCNLPNKQKMQQSLVFH